MKLTPTVAPIMLVMVLAVPAGAEHCVTYSTSRAHFEQPPYYVTNNFCLLDCIGTFYLYEESNGLPGLQRADEWVDDTCHYQWEPDVLLASLEPAYDEFELVWWGTIIPTYLDLLGDG